MKRNIHKKRLMKNTTSVMSILVAAILIFTSATAVNTVNNQEQAIENEIILVEANPGQNSFRAADSPQSQRYDFDDWLYYHGGYDNNAIGFDGAIVWEGAMRLTPTELGPYDGYDLTTVRWYQYDLMATSLQIKIYDEGTSTQPGSLLTSDSLTISTIGWQEFDLTLPVTVDASKDIWVSVEFDQTAAGFPFGVDAGPAIVEKGDFIYYSGAWTEIRLLNLDYNWCIEAKVVQTGPPPEHDVALLSINSPEDGPAGVITPEVTVKNTGNVSETNVPVDMEIYKILPATTVLSDGFEDATPGYYIFPPPGWTIQNTSTQTWYKYSTGYARCSEDNYGAQDEWLITETFDCSLLTAVDISMYFYMATPNDDYVEILGSTDNGVTWPNMIVNITGYMGSGTRSYDITSWAAGESQVKIAWRWVSSASLTGSDYFYFRELKIGSPYQFVQGVNEDFNGVWGPLGDNPPADWTILDYGSESPPVWNNNDWHNYYYSTFGSNCARIYYSPYELMDEWLITPTVDCSAMSAVKLLFRQYLYFYSTYPGYGHIDGSIDNGATWTESIAYYDATQATGYYVYDISSWAAGESEVKLRFRYTSTGTQGRYWYVDDVMFGDITDEVVLFENYWFDDWWPTNWGPNGWMEEEVTGTTDADPNIWRAADDTYSTTPTNIDPYAGDYMAIYDTGLLYPHGASCRLYTPAMDWNAYGATVLTLKFMIHISNYGSSYTDHCDVQVSTDGTTWDTLESINTYDATNPGWVEKIIDLTSYASETTARLGFLAVDGGYRDIIIDDVSIEASPTLLEYDETEIIASIAPGESIDVEFDDWTPDDWQVAENVDISYVLEACTQLVGDENPGNDDKEGFAILSYPYLHDIAVIDIGDPTSGTAQTLPVEATIKNVGQFTECCYATDVQIGYYHYDINGSFSNFEANDGGYTVSGGVWEWGTPTGAGPGGAYSGTKLWATSLAAGYPAYTNAKLDSIPITVLVDADLTFWHWYDTEASYDGYNVKISTDSGATWTVITPIGGYTGTANTANPLYPEPIFCGHVQMYWEEETFDLSVYEGQQVIFRWHFGSDASVQYPGAYIDDVLVGDVTVTIIAEYDEEICTVTLEPGEEAVLIFPDWTPDALALGVSGGINYAVMAEQHLAIDTNPANDQMTVDITLEYWHDVGVKEITEPSIGRTQEWLHYDDGTCENALGLTAGGELYEAIRLTPTELSGYDGYEITQIKVMHGWPSGTPQPQHSARLLIWEEGTTTEPGTLVRDQAFIAPAGNDWVNVALDDPYSVDSSEDVWVGVAFTHNAGEFPCGFDTDTNVPDKGGFFYYEGGGWLQLGNVGYPGSWNLWAGLIPGGGPPGVDVFIQPGGQAFAAVMENIGVFPETGLDANAKLFAFNETGSPYKIYEANYTDFDLEPLGGQETATFGSYNFVDHGVYQLTIALPLITDDYPNNNLEKLGIGVDDTPPTSTHTIIPAVPDGEHGWYVSDVTVEFETNDGTEDWQSGVDRIEYRINGGDVKTGDSVTLTDDGSFDVEYRAVDNVGNEEAWNAVITINIDQTIPTVDLKWEASGGIMGWTVTFTATCSDDTSGMNRVEFFIEGAPQFTDDAEPYEWIIDWSESFEGVWFYAYAYDDAGNENVDSIWGGDIDSVPAPHSQTTTPVVRRQTNPL